MAAIPAATPTIKPQDTLPVKKPIPTETIANAAKALPALPVVILMTLHIAVVSAFEDTLAVTAEYDWALAELAKTSAAKITNAFI